MLTRLAAEIVLALAMLIAGSLLWQLFKREKFLAGTIHNNAYLAQLITPDKLDCPSPNILPFVEELTPGYALNIACVIEADRTAQRRTKLVFAGVITGILIVSYLLGMPLLLVNIVILFLSGIARVSQQARVNADQQILTLAIILDRWRTKDVGACEEWIKEAWTLRPLYDAVKEARGDT